MVWTAVWSWAIPPRSWTRWALVHEIILCFFFAVLLSFYPLFLGDCHVIVQDVNIAGKWLQKNIGDEKPGPDF